TMHFVTTSAAVLCLLAGAAAAIHTPETVFLDKEQATSLISRQKRNAPSTLEQACMEKVCTYEEARKFFQDSYRTDIFWSVYIDGDQCAEKPCKNGAMCSDSVGGYDCVCKSGFSGVHCERDETLCTLEKDKGCSQFCKPGYVAYKCSCARGWKLSTDREKCIPAVQFPCGKVSYLQSWQDRLSRSSTSNSVGFPCGALDCPWLALLVSSESAVFCSGVILKENLVLTTAQCASKYSSFQVAVGKRSTSRSDAGQQTLYVKLTHTHPRYVEGGPENDLAVIELRDRIIFKREVTAACLPERDFAESILMAGEHPAVVTGWKEPQQRSAFQDTLALNTLVYNKLPECLETHPNLMTNKMGCTAPREKADCTMSSGSSLLTLYRDVLFLTGVVSQPAGADCSKGYIFQKVSRYLGWLQQRMGSG
uniref:Protein Z, vitamin K-dependent plasma glycoprotein a n=1 Tax=Amphilophus citrinellus TaxID=61819 RepID=A0A3Q0T718_AMPCI